MKLTKESQELMSFFLKNNCLNQTKQTKQTDDLLKELFVELTNGVSYVKNKLSNNEYTLTIERIKNTSQIPKPSTFSPNSFPNEIRNHIDKFSLNLLKYSIDIFDRKINIIFLTEDAVNNKLTTIYNNYFENMLVWLYIVNSHSSKKCSLTLNIYIYHTTLIKILPTTNINILNQNNVNTAFTRTCPRDSEIVIFRKEEWFKCFIHETFHNFALDFSDMDMTECNKKILGIFKVKSELNLFESYTEFWARIMNTLFCSYFNMTDKTNVKEFLTNSMIFINFEKIFAFFQMVKVLNFMDIKYKNLYENTIESRNIRDVMYKEDSNVLSYYIITLILINNYQSFLLWCKTNNKSKCLLQFNKTKIHLDKFCAFIEEKYKSKNMIDGINCTQNLLSSIKQYKGKQHRLVYILRNLRMTICELG